VVIVGNGAVGKSSMIQRYCRGTFTKTYKKTIGKDPLENMGKVCYFCGDIAKSKKNTEITAIM
jgi:Ras-related protein Rab-23